MLCISEWTLAPRIARYTGMRLNEACRMWDDCVVKHHNIFYFNLDRWTKTKAPRIIPIAEKLIPYIVNQDLNELKKIGHKNDKYNRNIKKIKGLEKNKFHCWRTYANTRMMEAGIDKAVRMKVLRHKASKDDIHTGYTAVQLEVMKKAVDTIY